ncbi:MAG: low molecular weight protein-tyrosine-phosphatase [Rhodomicrobium sp.]
MAAKPAILFVCLGNICRSPLAAAAFRREAARIGIDAEIDSAGTGHWHAGEAPDRRAQAVARRYGIDIGGYRARQICQEDFHRFSHIIAVDHHNLAALNAMKPRDGKAQLSLLLDHAAGYRGQEVADPYYGGDDGFDVTWAEVTLAAEGLARRLAEKM